MKQKEIIEKIVKFLGTFENAKVISGFDSFQQRENIMIAVGITETEKLQPTLDDYRYSLEITVDSFIADDLDGSQFFKIVNCIFSKMNLYKDGMSTIFEQLPIVGIVSKGKAYSVNNNSNVCVLSFDLFSSFDKN